VGGDKTLIQRFKDSKKTFEELNIWKVSKGLCSRIYSMNNGKYLRDFGFKDQLQRASLSVMSNIAEGFERSGNKEFIKFLYYSKGSIGEVRSLLSIALELKYIEKDRFHELHSVCLDLSKQIANFIKYLKNN
jgi:four helix bundle protein